jgi:hypothetical protein
MQEKIRNEHRRLWLFVLSAALLLASFGARAQALSGTYTINSAAPTAGTNFISFTAAAAALNTRGVSGPVTINVSGGPYTEQLLLNQFTGTSATNRVTINGNGRTIQFGSNSSTQRAVITLDGADYVTVDSLNVDATEGGASTSTYGYGIQLVNNADNNIIRRCNVTTSTTSTSTFFVGISSSASATSATTSGAAANQNLTLENNTVTGGYYCITNVGNTTASPTAGIVLRNNRVRDFYLYGMYNLYLDAPQIIGNDVARPTRTSVSTFYGIYVSTGVRGATVEKNRIHQGFAAAPTSTSTSYCLYVSTSTAATATAPNDFVNNLIYDIGGTGLIYGIYNPGSSNVRFYNNTVSLDFATTGTDDIYGFYHTTGTGVEFKNNIVRVARPGSGVNYSLYFSSATGANIVSNYNDLSGSGSNYNTGYYAGTTYATLANWRTANSNAYDQNSVAEDPRFVSVATGNLRPTAAALNNVAQSLARVTDDITGATRSATPDIGAYEFTPALNDVAVLGLTSPVAPVQAGARTVTVLVSNNGTAPLTSLTLAYTLNGGTAVTQTFTGLSIASGATGTVTFTTQATLTAGANTIAITATLPNGQADPTPTNNTLSTTLYTALAGGAYTINNLLPTAGSNFASFTEAATALNNGGITGAATFTVSNGPYTEQFLLGEVAGTSATSRLTINGGGRTIRFGSSDTNLRAVVQLNGTDYTTINNLVIDATNNGTPGTYGWGVLLTNAADNDQITNCTVNSDLTSTSSNFSGIVVSGSTSAATTSGNAANNLTLEGNTVNGGYYGITLIGASTTAQATGNVLRNNTVRDFYFYGIYASYQSGARIIGNDVARPLRTAPSSFYGIYLTTGSSGLAVEKNRLHDPFTSNLTSTSAVYAIYLLTGTTATATATNDVVNNVFYNMNGNGTQYLIYNSGAAFSRIYNNTVSSDDQTASTATTYGIYSSGASADIKNNVVSITRASTGTKYGLYYVTNAPTSNYNNIYVPNGNVGYYTTAYATLANWQTANGNAFDQNSVSADPLFVAPATGNLLPANVALNNAGTPLTRVTDDITGATRGATPDLGAYEFTPVAVDVSAVALVGPAANAACFGAAEPLTVQIRNSGTATLNFATNAATVTVVVTPPTGAAQTFTTTVSTGTLASNATQNVVLPGTLNMTALGTYSFAITATAVGDLNASNNVLTPVPTRTVVAPVAGTLTPASSSICVSGTAALNLTGSANGQVQYQSSTSATGTFTDVSGATSAAYTTPVLTSTTYYRAKVSCNGREVFSNVATVTVNNPVILTAPAASTCAGGTATLTATAGGGGTVRYYTTATGGTSIGSGSAFVTPVLTANTTFYVAAVAGSSEEVGPDTNTAVGTAGGALNITYGLIFNVVSPTTLTGVYVYPGSAGVANIELQNSAGTVIGTPYQATFTAADVNVKTFVPLNFALPAGTGLRLMLNSVGSTTTLYRNTSGPVYPYTSPSGNVSITDNTFGAGYYYYFYDWQIGSECAGTRTPLTVTVTPGLVASLPVAAATICGNTPYQLAGTIAGTSTGATYTTSGTGTFSPNATTLNATYTPSAADIAAGTVTLTLTPTGPSAPCTSVGRVTLTVVTPPNASFSYPAGTYCAGSNVTVTPVLAAGATSGTFSTTGSGLRIDPATGVISLATQITSGTFTITNAVTTTGVCNGTGSTATITILPAVATPLLTAAALPGGGVQLSTNPVGGVLYQFFVNGVAVGPASTNFSVTVPNVPASASYTVVLVVPSGCSSAPSTPVVVTGAAVASLNGVSLRVYPNPTVDGQLTLELSGVKAKASQLTVLNTLGQVVYAGTVAAGTAALDLRSFASGVYTFRVQTSEGVLTQRVVRQ